MQKRLELEKSDALKDLTIRQVQDRKYDFKQLERSIEEVRMKTSEHSNNLKYAQSQLQECQSKVEYE